MSKKIRIPVPRVLSAQILVSSDRTCCVCRQPRKSVQLHHIDENPANNDPQNIAVLCLQCHDDTQLTGGFGRRLDAPTVALYRKNWLADVEKRRASAIDLDEPATPAEAAETVECYIVGHVGRETTPHSSRFSLFDAYARKRLSDAASVGIRALSNLAGWLSERMAFSLSVREFDRLLDQMRIPQALSHLLQDAGLMSSHGDRVSFAHEMFFDVFAADAVVHDSAGRPERLLNALTAPVNAYRKDLILGAIDDPLLRERVLPALADPECIAPCIAGSCGGHAQAWAHDAAWKYWNSCTTKSVAHGSNSTTPTGQDWSSTMTCCMSGTRRTEPSSRPSPAQLHEESTLTLSWRLLPFWTGGLTKNVDDCRVRHGTRSDWRDRIFHASFYLGFEPCPAIATICSGFNRGVSSTSGNRDLSDGTTVWRTRSMFWGATGRASTRRCFAVTARPQSSGHERFRR